MYIYTLFSVSLHMGVVELFFAKFFHIFKVAYKTYMKKRKTVL